MENDASVLNTKKFDNNYQINNNHGSIKRFFIKLSGALMLPITVMSIVGIFLGIGAYIMTLQDSPSVIFIPKNNALKLLGNFLINIGKPIFNIMPLLFATAIAIAFTESTGVSAIAAILGFIAFSGLQTVFIENQSSLQKNNPNPLPNFLFDRGTNFMLKQPKNIYVNIFGMKTLNTGIFGAFIVGIISAYIFNIFSKTKLNKNLVFFDGKLLAIFMIIIVMIILSILTIIIWPYILFGIEKLSLLIINLSKKSSLNKDGVPQLLLGFTKRALMPFGLHSIFSEDINSFISSSNDHLLKNSFIQGEYSVAIILLPIAVLAIGFAAPKGKKTLAFVSLIPATISSILTGITEPLEFMLLFLSPIIFILFEGVFVAMLYGGIAKFGGSIPEIHTIGNIKNKLGTIDASGGLLDLMTIIFKDKQMGLLHIKKWWLIFATGGILSPVYFILLTILIKILDLPTVGRINIPKSNIRKAEKSYEKDLRLQTKELRLKRRSQSKDKRLQLYEKRLEEREKILKEKALIQRKRLQQKALLKEKREFKKSQTKELRLQKRRYQKSQAPVSPKYQEINNLDVLDISDQNKTLLKFKEATLKIAEENKKLVEKEKAIQLAKKLRDNEIDIITEELRKIQSKSTKEILEDLQEKYESQKEFELAKKFQKEQTLLLEKEMERLKEELISVKNKTPEQIIKETNFLKNNNKKKEELIENFNLEKDYETPFQTKEELEIFEKRIETQREKDLLEQLKTKTPEEITKEEIKNQIKRQNSNSKSLFLKNDDYFIEKSSDLKSWVLIKVGTEKPLFSVSTKAEALNIAKTIPEIRGKNIIIKKIDGTFSRRVLKR
ncbi:MAG: PTS transporter subunit EIIC [Mycoplasma sp.]|nr:PTS transporter subunit EIIC [Mycoplasma sp.]